MELEKLEKQVLLWNRAAILVPIFVTGMLMLAYFLKVCDITTLFYIACGMYFFTAVIWWWWTMKSVHLLVKILKKTNKGIDKAVDEIISIRADLQQVDISYDK